jgi:hypothetical protein
MFGGDGYPGQGNNVGQLNDLLNYNVTTGLWTYYKGDTTRNNPGIYGTMGAFASANKPGGREYNTFWKNTGSNLWLFGGEGWDKDSSSVDHMNDLWVFGAPCNPDSVVSASGSNLCSGKSATLSVSPRDNSTVSWYSSPTATTVLGNSATLITTPLTASNSPVSYTFYVGIATCSQSPRTPVVLIVSPAPQVQFTPLSPLCSGVTFTLNASGAQTYTWHTGAHTQVITATAAAGPYTVTLSGTDQQGCTATASSTIMVIANPKISVAGPTAACAGTGVTYTASGAPGYVWSNASQGATCYMIAGPFGSITFITVVGTDTNGCQASYSTTLTSLASPTLTTVKSQTKTVCNNDPITFTVTGASSYSWSSGQTTSVVTVTAGIYGTHSLTVIGTGTNGCSSTATVSYVRSECAGFSEQTGRMPLTIYPNPSDGTFVIDAALGATTGTIRLVNDMGQLLWTKNVSKDENKFEVNLPPGIYLCTLTANNGVNWQSKLIIR